MTSFQVDRGQIRETADAYDSAAKGMESIAAGIQEPDPMMLGVFLQRLVAGAGPMVTTGARDLLRGVGRMDSAYANNLRSTAQAYEAAERTAAAASSTMVGE